MNLNKEDYMRLRKLMMKDAELMLEWMHDKDVVLWMQSDFASKTLSDCERFIQNNQDCDSDLNMAIVDDSDEYMGTVSLKHIDKQDKNAEFAITVRKKAMGKGFSQYGMKEILRIGFSDLGLDNIFWCVSVENKRAISFYDKSNAERIDEIPEKILNNYSAEQLEKMIWYVVNK